MASLLQFCPLSSLLRSLCSLNPNICSYFVCPFILFIRFHIEVKSYDIGLSDWLIALGIIVCSSIHAVTKGNSSFLHLSSIPLCKCTMSFLSSHLLMGTWAVSRSYCQDYCNSPPVVPWHGPDRAFINRTFIRQVRFLEQDWAKCRIKEKERTAAPLVRSRNEKIYHRFPWNSHFSLCIWNMAWLVLIKVIHGLSGIYYVAMKITTLTN